MDKIVLDDYGDVEGHCYAIASKLNELIELVEEKFTSTNNAMPKLPTLDECYRVIPFPNDAREAAMFVAGVAECHKFIGRQLRQ